MANFGFFLTKNAYKNMKTIKICPKTLIYGIESKISIPNIENYAIFIKIIY